MDWAGPEKDFSGRNGLRDRPDSPRWGEVLARLGAVLSQVEPQAEAVEPLESALREVVLWASETGRLHLSLRAQTVVRGLRQQGSHDLADALPKLVRELEHAAWALRSDRSFA